MSWWNRAVEGRPVRGVENLVTRVSRDTWLKIETLLVGSGGMTAARWLGLVARYRVDTEGLTTGFAQDVVDRAVAFEPSTQNVRIVATVPTGLAGRHLDLTEAQWGRALVEWALLNRIDAEELVEAFVGDAR